VKAAPWPREEPLDERLLVVDSQNGRLEDAHVGELPRFLRSGDVLVVNDAATLPASLRTVGGDIEMRLMGRLGDDRTYRALLFGEGDFRTPTESRPPPPEAREGIVLSFASGLSARVLWVDPSAPRFCHVRFDRDGVALFRALYSEGAPIQYAHVARPLPLWHVQSTFASRPWAFEAPSAGRPFTWELIARLRARDVAMTWVTHAAGISSTGERTLDDRLPLPERYSISGHAVRAIDAARARGGRVVAVGTTVTRALEANALTHGRLVAGEGEATVVLGPGFRPRVVDGLFTGMHARGTSHFALLRAFAPEELLNRAMEHAECVGYLEHEFGDSCLLLPTASPAPATANAPNVSEA
jgi:S-adenosylmethionine:tRNA ribosyltransferase-isomerase